MDKKKQQKLEEVKQKASRIISMTNSGAIMSEKPREVFSNYSPRTIEHAVLSGDIDNLHEYQELLRTPPAQLVQNRLAMEESSVDEDVEPVPVPEQLQ